MPLNVKHINKILAHIRGDVRRLYMPLWGITKKSENVKDYGINFAKCGTACCFAGWSHLLSMPKKDWSKAFVDDGRLLPMVKDEEAERMGLTLAEASMLFWGGGTGVTPEQQFNTVKSRLRTIIQMRVANGELSAKKIRV
jgi:uncharacterized DUF497 family protein